MVMMMLDVLQSWPATMFYVPPEIEQDYCRPRSGYFREQNLLLLQRRDTHSLYSVQPTHRTAQHGTAWHSMAWHGTAWHSIIA